MNRFSEQLLEAFEVAMDEKLSKLQYDKTIQATITEIKNINTGEYKVKYQEGIITAYAKDPSEEFKVGDDVYVIVPQSDFTSKKFISHKITSNTIATGQYTDLSTSIIEVSPNLSALGITYTGQTTGQDYWSLIAGNTVPDEIQINSGATLSSNFNKYLEKYEYLQIKAEFKTTFDKDHTKGDYGIELGFRMAPKEEGQEGQLIPYFLKTSDFVGDPYHLWTWTPQSVVVKLSRDSIKSLAGISFYEKDFDDSVGEQTSNSNIFMRNLSLSFVEQVDLTQAPYYLTIFPKEGILFPAQSSTPIHLTGEVIHYGENVDPEKCLFKWFKRDLSITIEDEGYSKQAGWGWKPIEDNDVEHGAEAQELVVPANVVVWQQSYKLVAIYNQEVVMAKEITLYKETSEQLYIYQTSQNDSISLKLSSNSYVGLWYYLGANGTQQLISDQKTNTQNITSYLFYSPMTFYCSVYKKSNGLYYGELTYTMRDIESDSDVSVVFTGESVFCYDANGNIGLEYSLQEQSLTPEIVFADGIMTSSVSIEWLDFNGNVISETGENYNSSGSMIKSVRVDNNTKSLQYKIKNTFEEVPIKKNNTFKLRITAFDGQVYTFEKEIIFIKVGDPGTNGTRYQSIIRTISENPFVATSSGGSLVKLQCDVYRGSQQLSKNDCDIKWEAFHLTLTEDPNQFGVVTVKANDNKNDRYVKATIKIKNASESTTLYNFYGVDSVTNITNFNNTADKAEFLLGILKLPYVIQYQASGLNPSCRKQVPTINKTTIASTTPSLLAIQNESFIPAKEFNPEDRIALLSLTHTSTAFTVYHPIPMYINTFGNEAINGWDGVSLDLGNANDPHVFAPQVGAGKKDANTNKFTGVVMGRDSAQNKIGLYGYKDGVSTFGLREDGTAYFGASGKGRIDIDGTQAVISGGGGGDSANGMTITLAKQSDAKNDAIRIGNGNFVVAYDGTLIAKNANIEGVLTAGTGSKIGGWTIQATKLENGSNSSYVALNTNTDIDEAIWAGNATSTKAPFRVTKKGALVATNATITGTINASEGYIGYTIDSDGNVSKGWKINQYGIYSSKEISSNTYYVGMSIGTHNRAFYAGATKWTSTEIKNAPFSVGFDGSLKATNAIISGTITAGSGSIIGGWNLTDTQLYSGTVYLDSSTNNPYGSTDYYRIWAGNETPSKAKFYVTNKGVIKATDANITGIINAKEGYLGGEQGWIIKEQQLYSLINTQYQIGVNQAYYSNLDFLEADKKLTTEVVPIFNYRSESTKKASFTFGESSSDTKYYTNKTSIDILTEDQKPYIGLSSKGNINNVAIWAGSKIAKTAPFRVTHSGYLVAEQATIQGKIVADSGQIGGWNLTNSQLYSGTVYLDSSTNNVYNEDSTDYYRIWAGNKKPSKAKFYVTNKGVIKATDAIIKGDITATSGYLGGWTIDTAGIKSTQRPYIKANSKYYTDSALSSNEATTTRKSIQDCVLTPSNSPTCIEFRFTDNPTAGPFYTAIDNVYSIYLELKVGSSSTTKCLWAGHINADYAPFSVTMGGSLIATDAEVTGKITAQSGKIGGWTINDGRLYSGKVSLYSGTTNYTIGNPVNDYYRIWAGAASPAIAKFYVTNEGSLKATDAIIKGDITATRGSIGTWIITTNAISTLSSESIATTNATTGMAKTGFPGYIQRENATYGSSEAEDKISNIAFWSGMNYVKEGNNYYLQGKSNGMFFAVTHSGQLYCRKAKIQDATIEGSITVGNGARIGDWYIRDGILQNSSTGEASAYIGPRMVKLPGLTLTQGETGETTASFTGDINAGGRIGGWTINSGSLQSGNVVLNSSGTISGATISGGSIKIGQIGQTNNYNFTVDTDGTMTANGTLSFTGATGDQNIISVSGSYQSKDCTGSLGLATGSDGSGVPTYNTRLYSSRSLILKAGSGAIAGVGAVTVDTVGGFYVNVGNVSNIISVPSSGTAINLGVTADGLTILENNTATSLASYVSRHGGSGGGTAVFG